MNDRHVSFCLSIWMIALSAIGLLAMTPHAGPTVVTGLPRELSSLALIGALFALTGIVGIARFVEALGPARYVRRPDLYELGRIYLGAWRAFLANTWILVAALVVVLIAFVGEAASSFGFLAVPGGWSHFWSKGLGSPGPWFNPLAGIISALTYETPGAATLFLPQTGLTMTRYTAFAFAVVILVMAPRVHRWLRPLTADPEYSRDAQLLQALVTPLAIVSAAGAVGFSVSLWRTGRLPGLG